MRCECLSRFDIYTGSPTVDVSHSFKSLITKAVLKLTPLLQTLRSWLTEQCTADRRPITTRNVNMKLLCLCFDSCNYWMTPGLVYELPTTLSVLFDYWFVCCWLVVDAGGWVCLFTSPLLCDCCTCAPCSNDADMIHEMRWNILLE